MSIFKKNNRQIEEDRVPATVEEAIPILGICGDGIFLVGKNLWSKTFSFTDINYAVASHEDKEKMFLGYSEILNSLDSGATAKITINNRRIQKSKFEKTNMLPLMGDSLDRYRNEYNSVLERNANLSTGVVQDKYFTVTFEKRSYEEAKAYFNRVGEELKVLFAKLGSKFEEVSEEDKIRMLYDFFHRGHEDDFGEL